MPGYLELDIGIWNLEIGTNPLSSKRGCYSDIEHTKYHVSGKRIEVNLSRSQLRTTNHLIAKT